MYDKTLGEAVEARCLAGGQSLQRLFNVQRRNCLVMLAPIRQCYSGYGEHLEKAVQGLCVRYIRGRI